MSLDAAKIVYKKLAQELLALEGQELTNQGHRATGQLIDTLENPVTDTSEGIAIEGKMNRYGLALEAKRQPGKPPPVSVLIKWIRTKGISSPKKTTRQIAFAIQEAIRREGIPTTGRRTPNGKGSFRFSKVGRRTAWITRTLADAEKLIDKRTFEAVGAEADVVIDNIVRNFQKAL